MFRYDETKGTLLAVGILFLVAGLFVVYVTLKYFVGVTP